MSDRVLSTGEARDAIRKMQDIINGSLLDQINALNAQGTRLSDPNVWDGQLARQFRSDWRQIYQKLTASKNALDDLRQQIKHINDDIMNSGGNR
jgi:uncharacterized protein YukE